MASTKMIHTPDFLWYTGSNGAEMSAFMNNRPIKRDTGTVLEIYQDGSGIGDYWTFNVGDAWSNQAQGFWPADQFAQWVKRADMTPTPPNPTGTSDIVSISVPLLILGGTADRPITWNRPFSDANYKLSFAYDVNTLGKITCAVKSGTKTASGVTIMISAGLAVTVLGVVHVLATT